MGSGDMEKVGAIAVKEKYPWYIIFILGDEFCERFTFYGMKTVLTIYFSQILLFSDDTTTFYYHFFVMLCYFFPIFGAFVADGVLGKFKTMFSLSVVYIIGLLVLTLSAIPNLHFAVAGSLGGLFLIAVGTGGIKPCVAAYGADQFKPGQEVQREAFFSYFYVAINAGSLISTFTTPILRSNVHCFGSSTCYPLAFGVPAVLMAVALACFLLGRPFYKDTAPTGSLMSRVFFCICHAIANNVRGRNIRKPATLLTDKHKMKEHESNTVKTWTKRIRACFRTPAHEKENHWLDSATDEYDVAFVRDVKQLLQAMTMCIPIPMAFALFEQTGSRWTLQGLKMDGRITDTFYWLPDQMLICIPVLMLTYIPCLELGLYPVLRKYRIPFSNLSRIATGMTLTGVSFVIAGFLQFAVARTMPTEVAPGTTELHIFNANPCSVSLSGPFINSSDSRQLLLAPYEHKLLADLPIAGTQTASFVVTKNNCPLLPLQSKVLVDLREARVISLFLVESEGQLRYRQFEESKAKPGAGKAKVRLIVPFPPSASYGDTNFTFEDPTIAVGKEGREFTVPVNTSTYLAGSRILADITTEINQGNFLFFNNQISPNNTTKNQQQLNLRNGGVYTVILRRDSNTSLAWERYTMVEPNSLSLFWQIPQYFVLTLGEVLVGVSGLSFSYCEAPESMKSVMQAAWLLTTAFGSLIVMIFSGAHLVHNQAAEFFVFAGLIFICAFILALMASRYRSRSLGPIRVELTADAEEKPRMFTTQNSSTTLVTETDVDEAAIPRYRTDERRFSLLG